MDMELQKESQLYFNIIIIPFTNLIWRKKTYFIINNILRIIKNRILLNWSLLFNLFSTLLSMDHY